MKSPALTALAATAFALAFVPGAGAQTQVQAGRLEFDAASVKVDNSGLVPRVRAIEGGPGTDDPGRITYRRMPLMVFIGQAYDISGDQVLGQTDNLTAQNFEISATFPPTTTKEQFRVMLQNLLADRFHLVVHHETRNFPGYEIVVAPGGIKFTSWAPDPNAPPRIPARPLLPGQGGFYWKTSVKPPMVHAISRQSMADFARDLQGLQFYSDNTRGDEDRDQRLMAEALSRSGSDLKLTKFVDKTGLTGLFECNLDFEGAMVPRASEGGITLSEALEKQLGLKLVKVKSVPVDVLVIDHIDKLPTEN